jgi:hypothetical protein
MNYWQHDMSVHSLVEKMTQLYQVTLVIMHLIELVNSTICLE